MDYHTNLNSRILRANLCSANRIVIKIGTSSLTYENGKIHLRRIDTLTRVISDLMNQGKEIILVSSGAIGVGVDALNLHAKPTTVSGRQAVAAVGQCHVTAQILLTKDIVERAESKRNAVNTFLELFKIRAIPVVNENDTVSVDEIKFGDNDNLSYIVAKLTNADLLIILTDIDGYYNKNPNEDPEAELYHNIVDLSEKIEQAAGGAGSMGTGGMLTKVHASRLAADCGINAVIANGGDPAVIYSILDGEDVGTLFVKRSSSL